MSNFQIYHLVLQQALHTLKTFVANLGVLQSARALKNFVFNLLAFAIFDFLAISQLLKINIFI
jgi:hypothetical protein